MALIFLQSIERLANPHTLLTHPELGIGVSLAGMILTTLLVAFQTYVARRTKSLIVAADRAHYASDILFNLGVLVAYALSAYGGMTAADPLIAILIALIVLWSTKPIAIRAFNNLMDREMPDDEKARIVEIVTTMPEVRGHHGLKTRYSGLKAFIQLHIDIDANLNFREAHTITDRLEHAIAAPLCTRHLADLGARVIRSSGPAGATLPATTTAASGAWPRTSSGSTAPRKA